MDASYDIAAFATSMRWEAIDDATRLAAAAFLHDSLCVGVAGAKAPLSEVVLQAAIGWGGPGGKYLVLGRNHLLQSAEAAFVNAFQIHTLEFDCVHESAVVHPMATVLAAVLATVDDDAGHDGRALLTALVVGVQVASALGLAATTPLRFFRPATAGVFGSVSAIASLRKLDKGQTRAALGIALAFASGTMQAHLEGQPTLPLQIAQAARSAVQACTLAVAGFPGPQNSIEGPYGYLTLFETAYEAARLRTAIYTGFRMGEVSWKPFPSGRASHGGIVAVQSLIEQGLTADTLGKLEYRAPSLIQRLVGRPAIHDMTPAHARLCFPWLAAVTMTSGTVGLNDFAPARLNDPALLHLAGKVGVIVDDNPNAAAFTPAIATAMLTDGSKLEVVVPAQLGSPEWPLSRAQHLAKARACLAFADIGDRHDALTALIDALPETTRVAAALNAVLRRPTH